MSYRTASLTALALALAAPAMLPARAAPPALTPMPASDIVVGQSAPLSGPFAALGRDYRNGALLAFDAANRQGGVAGRKVRLVTLDDAYAADRAESNARALIHEHKAVCFLNHMFTNTVLASLPIASRAGVPFVGPYTGHSSLYRQTDPLLFVTRASFSDELNALANYASTVGYARVGLVYYANEVGNEFRAEVERRLARTGTRLASAAAMEVGGDAEKAAQALAVNGEDAIILGVSGSDAVRFIRGQAAGAARRPIYLARSLVSSHQLHAELGPLVSGVVVSQLVPSPFRPSSPLVRQYLSLVSQRGGDASPSFVEFEGFINATFLLSVLRRTEGDVTRASLARALGSSGKTDLGGYVIDFTGGSRSGSTYVELTMLRADGSFAQ